MNAKRKQFKQENIQAMVLLADAAGLPLLHLSADHLRVRGPTTVDYWPGPSKAWALGSPEKAIYATPKKVMEMVAVPRPLKKTLTVRAKPDLLPTSEDESPPWD